MAVINQYVNSLVAAGKRDLGHFVGGVGLNAMVVTFEVAAADDDGSIYRIVKDIHPDVIITAIKVWNDALTSGTSWNLGLYDSLSEGGAIIGSGNQFLSAADFSSARLHAAPLDGMTACDIASVGNKVFEWAAHTILTKRRAYDICLTATTVGSAAGTVTVQLDFMT